jgi:hypothetical protein
MSESLDRWLLTNQQIYEDVQRSRPPFPGGPDDYRRREYRVDRATGGWSVRPLGGAEEVHPPPELKAKVASGGAR